MGWGDRRRHDGRSMAGIMRVDNDSSRASKIK